MNLTDDQKKDVTERATAFQKEFEGLLEKHLVGCVAIPEFRPSPTGSFHVVCSIQIIDKKYLSTPSPIQDND